MDGRTTPTEGQTDYRCTSLPKFLTNQSEILHPTFFIRKEAKLLNQDKQDFDPFVYIFISRRHRRMAILDFLMPERVLRMSGRAFFEK